LRLSFNGYSLLFLKKMNAKFLELGRRQLDEKLKPYRVLRKQPPPSGGWIRAIRTGLAMSAHALAERLGVSQATVFGLEQSEVNGSITLKSLKKAAAAMNCDVVYALVPRGTLEKTLEHRAHEKALSMLSRVGQSMKLEAQEVGKRQTHEQAQSLTRSLLEDPKSLWK
jgi:predicted DNA-binding mobile mystery protein A